MLGDSKIFSTKALSFTNISHKLLFKDKRNKINKKITYLNV